MDCSNFEHCINVAIFVKLRQQYESNFALLLKETKAEKKPDN